MNHTTIEEQQIAERYVLGKLPPEEAARFEEHYLSCPECLDRLELADSMERGFKRAAGQDAARLAATRQLALVAWLSRLGRSRQMAALAMTVFVVAVLPGLFALRQVREREHELAATRSALERERQQSAAGSRTASEAAKLRADLEASRRDLAREQQARAAADQELAAARQPQGNVPLLFLNAERGAGSEPTHRLRLPRTPSRIILALEVDPPHKPSYRAVLRDTGGKELWHGEGLHLNEMESLSLSLPSTLLAPGDYTLDVEGRRFAFRALPPA